MNVLIESLSPYLDAFLMDVEVGDGLANRFVANTIIGCLCNTSLVVTVYRFCTNYVNEYSS